MKKLLLLSLIINCQLSIVNCSAQWTQTSGPADGLASVIIADANHNFIIGSRGGGVYVSADSGQTWAQSNTGINIHSFSVTYMDTVGQSIFISGQSSYINYLFESTDGGQSWVDHPINVCYLTGMGHIGSRLFIGGNCGELIYSDDMGGTFDTLSTYAIRNVVNEQISVLSTVGNDLFVAVPDSGLYKSTDGGSSWIHANAGLNAGTPPSKIISDGTNHWAIFPYSWDLFKSTDGGLTWNAFTGVNLTASINDIRFLNNNLFILADPNILISTDGGQTFAPFSGNVNASYVGLAYNGNAFVSSTEVFNVALQRSTDGGHTWADANSGYANSRITQLFVDGSNLFASSYDRGMFLSTDFGNSYTRTNNGPIGLYAAADIVKVGSDILQCGYSHIYKTSDNGANWTDFYSNSIPGTYECTQFLLDGTDLYMATSVGVYKSTNLGPWTALNNGLTAGFMVNSIVKNGTRMFITGKTNTTPYVAKVYYSDDNGANWIDNSASFNFGDYTEGNELAALNGSVLLASLGTVYVTNDNGANWTTTGSGLPFGLINTFFVNGSNIYAGMGTDEGPYGNVLVSFDGGANFTSIVDNLFNSNVTSFEALDGDLYVGTFWGGVWKRPLSSIVVNIPSTNPSKGTIAMYPNPAGDNLSVKQTGILTISNLAGQVLYTQNLKAKNTQISTRELPAGIYTVQLLEGNKLSTDKLVIAR